MERCVQWNPLTDKRFRPIARIQFPTARSAGQRLTTVLPGSPLEREIESVRDAQYHSVQ